MERSIEQSIHLLDKDYLHSIIGTHGIDHEDVIEYRPHHHPDYVYVVFRKPMN